MRTNARRTCGCLPVVTDVKTSDAVLLSNPSGQVPGCLKIVHVTPSFAKGGGERVVIDLANEQAALGHDVTIIAGRADGLQHARHALDERIAIKVIAPHSARMTRVYVALPGWQLRHHAWLRSRDIVHCHLTMGAVFGTLARVLVRGLGRRPIIVETYHAVGMAIPRSMRSVHAAMAATRDGLVLMARDDYWNRFVRRHASIPIHFVENGVRSSIGRVGDAEERMRYRCRIGIPDDCRHIVGTVGQFRPDRQPWMHVDVFSRIAKKLGPGVYFVIAGDGPARMRVETAITEAGLEEKIKLLGVTPTAAGPASLMDLYITLAVGPVVGIAALEAMFATVPTIAIQLNADYARDEGDFVWSSTDLGEVADKAVALLRDPSDLAELSRAQHDYVVERYDMATVARRYEEIYRSILDRRRVRATG